MTIEYGERRLSTSDCTRPSTTPTGRRSSTASSAVSVSSTQSSTTPPFSTTPASPTTPSSPAPPVMLDAFLDGEILKIDETIKLLLERSKEAEVAIDEALVAKKRALVEEAEKQRKRVGEIYREKVNWLTVEKSNLRSVKCRLLALRARSLKEEGEEETETGCVKSYDTLVDNVARLSCFDHIRLD